LKNKKPHIVFLTPGFAISEKDSTTIPALQVYLKNLQMALPDAKFTLIAFQFPFSKKTYSWNGMKVIPLNGRNKHLKKLWTWNKALRILKKHHRKQPITAIHSFWIGECSMIGARFAKKYALNHITTVMGQEAHVANTYVESLKNSETKICTLSKSQHALLLEKHHINSTIIPWQLDTNWFPELQASSIDILGVGSLNEVKNYSTFIAVISVLVSTNPALKVAIIGEGNQRSLLEKQIQEHHLENNIKLLGTLSRKEVLAKMAQASVLLHTSTYESFGFVFLEALYSGMQIVSFPVGIAENSDYWQVCNSETEMVQACVKGLNTTKENKERIASPCKTESVSSYLKYYNE